jgi:hypothetical protein
MSCNDVVASVHTKRLYWWHDAGSGDVALTVGQAVRRFCYREARHLFDSDS